MGGEVALQFHRLCLLGDPRLSISGPTGPICIQLLVNRFQSSKLGSPNVQQTNYIPQALDHLKNETIFYSALSLRRLHHTVIC